MLKDSKSLDDDKQPSLLRRFWCRITGGHEWVIYRSVTHETETIEKRCERCKFETQDSHWVR